MMLKSKHVRKKREEDPDYPRYVVMIRKNEQFQKAQNLPYYLQAKELKLKRPRRYQWIYTKVDPQFFDDLGEAYKAAYVKVNALGKKRKKAKVLGDSKNSDCSVYCIKLKSNVWGYNIFKKANKEISKRKKEQVTLIDAYYVGQTSNTIEERYKEHRDPRHKNSTTWGKKYFLNPFEEAINFELLQKFEKETGLSATGLLHGKSVIIEHQFAKWAREKGLGAYCA